MSVTVILKTISTPELDKWRVERDILLNSIPTSPATIIQSIQDRLKEEAK
jgi:hypothetical protein